MGRHFAYLASSNSQLRDSGAYFMERFSHKDLQSAGISPYAINWDDPKFAEISKSKIIKYRQKLGKFEKIDSIPKAMARLGQCFTQARACNGVEISNDDFNLISDIYDGSNANGSPYCMTDGVGMISEKLAREMCKIMGIQGVPSAFQFRFRGLKGMLTIDPNLDRTSEYFEDIYKKGFILNEYGQTLDLAHFTKKCIFRESQFKFSSSSHGKDKWPIELVKWSAPSPVTLNRPFISILDQVSALQSLECHRRIVSRIEELLSLEMNSFSNCIISEEKCRSKLEGMPRRVHFASLEQQYGFSLSTEPFFRGLIKASIVMSMMRLQRKQNIPIPSNVARSMFGVTDETAQLQYGQVFVQYTENVNNKNPWSNGSSKRILTGPIMVTKFPAMTAGDVRMYEAVDIPELRHLNDVIVFPQSGPRSMPDEMAGSDLDGDEYAVIWDPQLYFERNEKAFAYCSDKPMKANFCDFRPFDKDRMDEMMDDFYAEFMKQEEVGVTANNHLHQSDQFGINSSICDLLAQKNAMALDYSKSGVAPTPLTFEWVENADRSWTPPEKAERKPDFSANRTGKTPIYASSRLLGTIHRELRSIGDVVEASAEKPTPIVLDPLLDHPKWKTYKTQAQDLLTLYNGRLRTIMDTFGVGSESELFSGCFREIRNRQSDREQDDLSLYSTENMIEAQVTGLFKKYRETFFDEFDASSPAYMRLTVPQNERNSDEQDVLRRVCRTPSDLMMAKAVAYYKVCYENATHGDRKLSFAWIAFDILNCVRRDNLLKMDQTTVPRLPQLQSVCDHRNAYIKDAKSQGTYSKFMILLDPLDKNSMTNQEKRAVEIIRKYISHNMKLQECLFIIDSWAREKGFISDGITWYHLALLVIMVATGQLGGSLIDERQHLIGSKVFEALTDTEKCGDFSHKLSDSDLDRLTLSVFRYFSTREFKKLKSLNFRPVGLQSVFLRGEWLKLHTSGTQTYYNLLLNLRFDELQISLGPCLEKRSPVRDGEPFVVELPHGVKYPDILRKLREISSCVEIDGRPLNGKFASVVVISCRGTTEAINELRDLTMVKIPRYSWQMDTKIMSKKRISQELTHLFYFKIMGTIWVEPKTTVTHKPNQKGPRQRNRGPRNWVQPDPYPQLFGPRYQNMAQNRNFAPFHPRYPQNVVPHV